MGREKRPVLVRAAVAALRLRRWRLIGRLPDRAKYLIVFAPHTCNWDLLLGLLAATGFGARVSWLGKSTIFRWPVDTLLRRLGGIPVDREHREGVVGQVVAAYAAADSLIVGMTPEGTRHPTPFWKSGFYHMALGADIPIVPASIDGSARRITVGPPLDPSGDLHRDMEVIRRFYTGAQGVHPKRAGAVRLREEARPPSGG